MAIESFNGQDFGDAEFRRLMQRGLRLMVVIAAVAAPLFWWKLGWQSAVLFVVGGAVSGSGVWELLRLMTAVMERMDEGRVPRPMASVLVSFFVQLGLAVGALYVSLKYLDGSVYALAGGLGLGVFALTIEGLRTVKAWTQ